MAVPWMAMVEQVGMARQTGRGTASRPVRAMHPPYPSRIPQPFRFHLPVSAPIEVDATDDHSTHSRGVLAWRY